MYGFTHYPSARHLFRFLLRAVHLEPSCESIARVTDPGLQSCAVHRRTIVESHRVHPVLQSLPISRNLITLVVATSLEVELPGQVQVGW